MAAIQQKWLVLLSIWMCCVLAAVADTDPPPIQPRVIGGVPVYSRCSEPYSWTVALRVQTSVGGFTYCSGVLMSHSLVITAARCLYLYLNQGVASGVAVIGERDLELLDPGEAEVDIADFKIHPGYNDTTYANNIALLRLSRDVPYSRCVLPARRYTRDPQACEDVDSSCVMVGWGPYAESPVTINSRLPRSASITLYDPLVSSVLAVHDSGVEPSEGNRLAEATSPGAKACLFDWGGVVSCKRHGWSVLSGIISDHNCLATPTPPVTVTDVPAYQAWVDQCELSWGTCPAL